MHMLKQPSSTKERLLRAAEQVFADKGFYHGAIDEIAKLSGSSKGGVYFHFPSKEKLFLSVMEKLGSRLMRRVEDEVRLVDEPVSRLEKALDTTLLTLCKYKTLAKLLLVKGYSMGPSFASKRQEVMGELADMTASLIDDVWTAQKVQRKLDSTVAAYIWLGAVTEIVVRWLEIGKPDPIEEALPTLKKMLLASVML